MRPTVMLAAGAVAAFASLLSGRPALAEYGSIAYDAHSGRSGAAWNQHLSRRADGIALRRCDTPGCMIRLRVGPRMCGALATTAERRGWGTGIAPRRAQARFAALRACQRFNSGRCLIRIAGCDR